MDSEEKAFKLYAGISHEDAERLIPQPGPAFFNHGQTAQPPEGLPPVHPDPQSDDALSSGVSGANSKAMADTTSELIDAKVAAAEARTDTKFARFEGRLDTISAQLTDIRSGQRTSFWGLAALMVTLVVGLVAVMGYGAQWFGLGMQSHDVLMQAAKEGAAQALAAAKH